MVADAVLDHFPTLDKHGFCVGNIAPDCNIENEDWSAFTPSRELTHWMQGKRKQAADCDLFCDKYILNRKNEIQSAEEYAFLLGYYSHLMVDAAFQAMIRDEKRVKAAWHRIKADSMLNALSTGMDETWDSAKELIPAKDRLREIHVIEASYLASHPKSGYLTEILPLKSFPDYIDYLPKGSIVRKVHIMGYLPKLEEAFNRFIAISQNEYASFVKSTTLLVIKQFSDKRLL